MIVPTAKSNENILNEGLSSLVEKVFQDENLLKVLAR